MVSITQKSRGCVLLLCSLAPSLRPPLTLSLFSTLTFPLWPALALSILSAPSATIPPIGNTTISTVNHATISPTPFATPPAILKSSTSTRTSAYALLTAVTPTFSSKTYMTTSYPQKSLSATSKTASLFTKTSLTGYSKTSSATNNVPPCLGRPASLHSHPIRYRPRRPPSLQPPKYPLPPRHPRIFPPPCTLKTPPQKKSISPHPRKSPPLPCKLPTLALKTTQSSPHKKTPSPLSKISLSLPPFETVLPRLAKPPKCIHTRLPLVSRTSPTRFPSTSPFPPSNSPSPESLPPSSPPKTSSLHLTIPPEHTHMHPSPVSTSPFPTTSLSLAPVTSPPPLAQTSPTPLPKTSSSPPKTTTSRKPRLPPPPPLPHTTGPLFEHQPFIVSWNIPDLVCNRYNISLDTSPFKGVATPAKVPGQFLSLFYTDRLGLYPHIDHAGRKWFYGGIPQRGNLTASMNKARADINYYIPSRTTRGLAMIDWEEWRPLWDRNWGTKRIYQTLSVAHAMQKDLSLKAQQATAKAKQQFQVAARSFMSGTLALGRAMRPNYLWGFYLFPNCYNYGWLEPGYTGQCSKEVRGQNDELLWLWESSTALYPSVYLQASLGASHNAALMVRNRVKEALRVSALPRRTGTAPVFVYTRPVFIDQNRRFLSQRDLVSTIGESAAVGASGAVLWGASADFDDKASCEALSSYLSSTLNPYITNVTAAAQLCSNFLCQGNGRCVRKNYDSNHYLHLNPGNFQVTRVQNHYLVLGRPSFADLKVFSRRFTCQCYEGLTCTPRKYRELAKALIFRVKQGLYKKAQTLNKAMLDDMQQASIAKENIKKDLKV